MKNNSYRTFNYNKYDCMVYSDLGVLGIVTVCVFVRHLFSFYPFYFDFHSAHYFLRVFRFLFMEHKQDYSVTSVKDVKVCF